MTIFSKKVRNLLFDESSTHIPGELWAFVDTFKKYATKYTATDAITSSDTKADKKTNGRPTEWPMFKLQRIDNGNNGCFAISAIQVLFRCQRFLSLIMSNFVDLHLIEDLSLRNSLFNTTMSNGDEYRQLCDRYSELFENSNILEARDAADTDAVMFVSYCKWLSVALVYGPRMTNDSSNSMSAKASHAVQELALIIHNKYQAKRYVTNANASRTGNVPSVAMGTNDPSEFLIDFLATAKEILPLFGAIESITIVQDVSSNTGMNTIPVSLSADPSADIVVVELPRQEDWGKRIDAVKEDIPTNDKTSSKVGLRLIGAWLYNGGHYIAAIVDRITANTNPMWHVVDSVSPSVEKSGQVLVDVLPHGYWAKSVIYERYDTPEESGTSQNRNSR